MLRLTTTCNSACDFCTLGDVPALPDRAPASAVQEMAAARENGCTEIVFMRGESTLLPDLPRLAARARALGFQHIQIQTNGRMLGYDAYLGQLVRAGVNFFEVSLFGPDAELNDAITRAPGSFDQTTQGLRNIVARGLGLLVTIPVVRRNYTQLVEMARLLAGIGVPYVQYNTSRPVLLASGWNTEPLVTLEDAAPRIREALREARRLGIETSTEAVPLCLLDPEDRAGADVVTDFAAFQVADLHRRQDSMAAHRQQSRPKAPECEGCRLVAVCPTTWAAYQELYGTSAFRRIE